MGIIVGATLRTGAKPGRWYPFVISFDTPAEAYAFARPWLPRRLSGPTISFFFIPISWLFLRRDRTESSCPLRSPCPGDLPRRDGRGTFQKVPFENSSIAPTRRWRTGCGRIVSSHVDQAPGALASRGGGGPPRRPGRGLSRPDLDLGKAAGPDPLLHLPPHQPGRSALPSPWWPRTTGRRSSSPTSCSCP